MHRASIALVLLALLPSSGAAQEETARVLVPAVASQGESAGVVTHLDVEVRAGSGRVFLATPPLSEPDFERAVHRAAEAASRVAGRSFEAIDFYFTLGAGEESIVEGPSIGAGAALAAAAALTGKPLRTDVAITGTIDHLGVIGPVGGILEKAEGAAGGGVRILLVPPGESRIRLENEARYRWGPGEIVVPGPSRTVDVALLAERDHNLSVVEVADLAAAVAIATSENPVLPARFEAEESLPAERTVRRLEVPSLPVLAALGAVAAIAVLAGRKAS